MIVFVFLVLGCDQAGYRDIRSYYFPLKKLTGGQVYEYRSLEGETPDYRYYRSFLEEDRAYLTETRYAPDLLPAQFSRYRVGRDEVLAGEVKLLFNEAGGTQVQVPAQIEHPDIFLFRVKENGEGFLFGTRWTDPFDSLQTTSVVQTRYFDSDSTIIYKGSEYPAIRLQLKISTEDQAAGTRGAGLEGLEVYARGLGLVYYEKRFPDGLVQRYALHDRYGMEVLEERFRGMR